MDYDDPQKKVNEYFEKREPTKNMMIWMKFYDNICERTCCHSTDCGSIKCSGCLTYLTGIPPQSRYQCIECEILPPETLNNPRPELCSNCFYSKTVLHHHQKFLLVNEKGLHTIERRTTGLSTQSKLVIDDFHKIIKIQDDSICQVCYDYFSEENPAVAYPGCKYAHGSPIKDKEKGIVDSKSYSHAECLINWYSSSNRDVYCGEPNYCEVCIFEEDKNSWKELFYDVKYFISKLKNSNSSKTFQDIMIECQKYCEEKLSITFTYDKNEIDSKFFKKLIFFQLKEKLIDLHHQLWLQKIIRDVFCDIDSE
jgi:hypothetical protein